MDFLNRFFRSRLSKVSALLAGYTFVLIFIIFVVLGHFFQLDILETLLKILPASRMGGINVLVVGLDDTDGAKRSDTIMVFHLDSTRDRIGALSIPRDTRLNVPGYGYTKINHAYAYGGIDLLQQAVTGILGLPIHYYIVLNIHGVESIINKLGGVDVTVDKNLNYEDSGDRLSIHVPRGEQHLQGREAMSDLPFRPEP